MSKLYRVVKILNIFFIPALGVNILIAVGHSGYESDQRIAQDCPDIDVVVGGHSHTFLFSGWNSPF